MSLTGGRTFVGFGFGAIQAGLFLYEAFGSGAFGKLVVAEVVPDMVAAVRSAGGSYSLNVAHRDRIERLSVGPVQIENPAVEGDRGRLVGAVAEAQEIATAVPSVSSYASANAGSIHRILAAGLRKKAQEDLPRAVVYAAENHNQAAELLQEKVLAEIPQEERKRVLARVRFLNTVIGKMSGVLSDPREIAEQSLKTVTPEDRRAFLVEVFNRILISRVRFPGAPGYERGIGVFKEKDDLLPFEEAKLYGHNATHALAAYVGMLAGLRPIADLGNHSQLVSFIRAAFIEESGEALIRKHRGVDALFTTSGYREYADDLLERMMNPHLRDSVERVGRDPARKLGWDDRLIGTIRTALAQGVRPWRYALGAAAALAVLAPAILDEEYPDLSRLVDPLWLRTAEASQRQEVMTLLTEGHRRLRTWHAKARRREGLLAFGLS